MMYSNLCLSFCETVPLKRPLFLKQTIWSVWAQKKNCLIKYRIKRARMWWPNLKKKNTKLDFVIFVLLRFPYAVQNLHKCINMCSLPLHKVLYFLYKKHAKMSTFIIINKGLKRSVSRFWEKEKGRSYDDKMMTAKTDLIKLKMITLKMIISK